MRLWQVVDDTVTLSARLIYIGFLYSTVLPINLQHWITASKDLDNLHIYINYYKTTNQPILSALLLMTCLRLLVLDLLHLVPVDILQLPPGTLYHSISAIVTLSLLLNVDWKHSFLIKPLLPSNRIPRLRIALATWRVIICILLTYLLRLQHLTVAVDYRYVNYKPSINILNYFEMIWSIGRFLCGSRASCSIIVN